MIIVTIVLLLIGIFIGNYFTEKKWSSNADSYLRHEYNGRIYKVMYADGVSKTPEWEIKYNVE